ncbi:DUF3515 family protein [Herbiconiux liangxiaofengii]|uniref:DUF3515 family protein n=1 Tax=Herbiconiux liangxiaofengii TaxID=3342795 RepID=UPI0035B92E37
MTHAPTPARDRAAADGHAPSRRRTRPRRLAMLLLTAAASGIALSGCAATVSLEPAADATDPSCADVIVRLPDTVADQQRRTTDAQGTGAWGDPASVLLHCGVPVSGPTSLPCANVNGVDWIVDNSNDPTYVFTTYGRTPAVEVVLDYDVVGGTSALDDLRAAVSSIPQTDQCIDANDVLGTATPTPAPTP